MTSMSFSLQAVRFVRLIPTMNPGLHHSTRRTLTGCRTLILAIASAVLLQCGALDSGPSKITLVHHVEGPPKVADLPAVKVKDVKSPIEFTVRVPPSGVSGPRYELTLGPSTGPPSLVVEDYELKTSNSDYSEISFTTRPYDADLTTPFGRLTVIEVLAPDMDYLPEPYDLLFKIKIGE